MKNKNKKNVLTGCLPVDMSYAACMHYKNTPKHIKEIHFSRTWWDLFLTFLMDKAPEKEVRRKDDTVIFNNVTFKKGHRFMAENMELVFHEENTFA